MSDAGRLSAALADRYRITRELGQGGMATVYLARDLKHDRDVALKVLKPELSAVLGADRFVVEIKTTASLQHPHILPLFDSGMADGFLFYVMPYVEGETLRDKLRRETQLDVTEALRIATEVADALDYAHRHGVIHRDIKPENILLHDGRPMVADFGIALAVSAAAGGRMTETGLSLGTPHYMSPEQATAEKEITARADIYSLAVVLYEMLAGEPPHMGNSAQQIIMKIVTDTARPVTDLRRSVPQHVAAALAKALEKLPADRFRSARAFAEALANPAFTVLGLSAAAVSIGSAPRGRWNRVTVLSTAVAVVLVGIAAWGWLRPQPVSRASPVARFTIRLPANAPLGSAIGTTIAVSPDGSRIVYVAGSPAVQLFVRSLDRLDAVSMPGTAGATQPFFSPDGQWIGFEQRNKLVKMAVAGGPVLPLCDLPQGILGASWGPGDTIVFAAGGRLMKVAAAGGDPRVLAAPDTGLHEDFRFPEILPDGRAALLTVRTPAGDRLGALALAGARVKQLEQAGSNPHYITGGHVLLAHLSGTVVTVPFDARRLELTGSAIPVAEGVEVGGGGAAKLGVSRDGDLVYNGGLAGLTRLVLVDRSGAARNLWTEPQRYGAPRIARDGRRIAVTVGQTSGSDIWIYDIGQRTGTRLTFDGTGDRANWSPDGRRVVYSRTNQQEDLYWVLADGSASPESLLVTPEGQWAGAFTPEGRTLVYRSGIGPRSIWSLRLDSARTRQPFLVNSFDNHSPTLSPDGRWLAYVSNESGRAEVFVRQFPGPGGRWQVSTDGGSEPRWSPTGREIFYRNGNAMMAAAIRAQPTIVLGDRVKLFDGAYVADGLHAAYDVTPDGRSFVMLRSESEGQHIVVVLNWFAAMRATGGRAGSGRR